MLGYIFYNVWNAFFDEVGSLFGYQFQGIQDEVTLCILSIVYALSVIGLFWLVYKFVRWFYQI